MQQLEDDSSFIAKEPCPECGSRDNLARYSDGHGYCFGCAHFEPGEGQDHGGSNPSGNSRSNEGRDATDRGFVPLSLNIVALPKRGLTERTCKFWGYGVGTTSKDEPCHVAQYRDTNGSLLAHKLRLANKDFPILKAKGTKLPLYGMWLWRGDRRSLIITEGELDALSVSQAQDHKYPVVSLPNGAQGGLKDIQRHYEWVCEFDKVVLMLDGDEPGREAAQAIAEALPPGKAFIADLGEYKDANEALVDGKPSAIINAFWNAKPYSPDGIVTSSDAVKGLRERRTAQMAAAISYPWPALTEITKGMRDKTLITWTAGSGIGKSTIVRHIAHHAHHVHGLRVGMLMLEEDKDVSLDGFIGIHIGKNLIVDPNACTDEEHEQAIRELKLEDADKGLVLYDHFGSTDVDNVCARIRFMAKAMGCKVVVLDHLSIMVSGTDSGDERKLIDVAMTKLRTLVQETGIILHAIVHLKRPQGDKGHEDGAEVRLGQLRGSHSIAQLSDQCIAAQKDPSNPTSDIVDLVVLKNRLTGERGPAGTLAYDRASGLLSAAQAPATSGFETVEPLDI